MHGINTKFIKSIILSNILPSKLGICFLTSNCLARQPSTMSINRAIRRNIRANSKFSLKIDIIEKKLRKIPSPVKT